MKISCKIRSSSEVGDGPSPAAESSIDADFRRRFVVVVVVVVVVVGDEAGAFGGAAGSDDRVQMLFARQDLRLDQAHGRYGSVNGGRCIRTGADVSERGLEV